MRRRKLPAVEAVLEIEGVTAVPRKFGQLGGIAVVANTTYAALLGRDVLNIEWSDDSPNASYDSAAYDKEMAATAAKPGKVILQPGRRGRARFASAKEVFTGEYHAQHLVQASMEPLVAVARIVGWQGRGVGADPEPLRRAKRYRGSSQDEARGRHGACDASRRRLRTQVQMGLHGRGCAHLAETRRRARAAAVDTRGRHPPLVLSHGVASSASTQPSTTKGKA